MIEITRKEARRRLKVALDDPQILGQPVTKELCDLVEAALLPNFDRAAKKAFVDTLIYGRGAMLLETDKPAKHVPIREYMRKRRAKAKT